MDVAKPLLPPPASVGAYLLAGGASQRMGRSKALLLLDGEPMVLRPARQLAPHVASVHLVGKRSQELEGLGFPLLYDEREEHALVHGLRAALLAPGPEWRFVSACDMPEVGAEMLGRLWRAAKAAGAPGSYFQRPDREEPEPLPSLWRAEVAARLVPAWGFAARDWVRHAGLLACAATAAETAALANVNTPDEWSAYTAERRGRA